MHQRDRQKERPPNTALKIGDSVEIHGLQGAKELNGLKGRIVSVEELSPTEIPSRFGVYIQSTGENKSVKGVNLRKASGGLEASPCISPSAPAAAAAAAEVKNDVINKSEGLRYRFPYQDPSKLETAPKKVPSKEDEHAALARKRATALVMAGSTILGFVSSKVGLIPKFCSVVLFPVMHIVGVVFFTDLQKEKYLLAILAVFGAYGGIGLNELVGWSGSSDSNDDSIGPWSIVMCFACLLYLYSFWTERSMLPPEYISGMSFFFSAFPAYSLAIVLSCIEFFVEWKYLLHYKIWKPAVFAGTALLMLGQFVVWSAVRGAGLNFWASCREVPEDEDRAGLEIPDRRIVQEGIYQFERHPTYLGAMLWGVGVELVLCNPICLLLVCLILWSSLLYVCVEEEQELYEEFPKKYAQYVAVTRSWVPFFNSLLEEKAFQQELLDNFENDSPHEEESDAKDELGSSEDEFQEPAEEDILSSWDGVQKGGALWNRQFREPWMLG